MRLLWAPLALALLTRGDGLVSTGHDPHAAMANAIKFFDGSREPDVRRGAQQRVRRGRVLLSARVARAILDSRKRPHVEIAARIRR